MKKAALCNKAMAALVFLILAAGINVNAGAGSVHERRYRGIAQRIQFGEGSSPFSANMDSA
jgi:hypothetical protein